MGLRPLVVAVVLLTLCCLAQCTPSWQPSSFPNPGSDARACGRGDVKAGASRICDPDHVIGSESRDVVEGIIQDIEAGREPYAMMDCGAKGKTGYKVAVALMERMALAPSQDPAAAAQAFAKSLHDAWGVGDAQCNNGVLLLLSVGDRQVYISTGAGALNQLPNDKVEAILSRMRPPLRAAEYDEAVEQAVVDIGLGLAGQDFDTGGHGWFDPVLGAFLAVIGGCFGFTWWKARKQRKEYSKCKQLLEKLKQEQQSALRTNTYQTSSCPICLEDFNSEPAASSSRGGKSAGSSGAGPSSGKAAAADSLPLLDKLSGDASGSTATGGEQTMSRTPLALPCGHRFCTPCITRWVDSGTTCPICRKPISGEDARDSRAAPLPSQQEQQAAGHYNDLFVPDMVFRLSTMQQRFPSYMDPGLVDDWSREAQAGHAINWDAASFSQMHDPSIRHSHHDTGSAGATTSFGGGSSFGGGGGGSSW